MRLKYINNNPRYGIDYDWNLIKREFKKLKIPKEVYNPYMFHEVVSGKYIMDISERDTGKSTNWLLLAMVINKLYGSEIVYMRERVDMITPKNSAEIFKTILAYDYVSQLTDGKYNRIRYASRRWYYWNDETGEEAIEPFMMGWGLDDSIDRKSSVQLPDSDLILFDEFISPYNYRDEFVDFEDAIKSIIRERDSPLIVLLANTINIQSQWFKEFEIYDQIKDMEPGQHKICVSSGGTIVDVGMVGHTTETMTEHRREHNARFFGFNNPKLNAIRGGGWAMRVYQHPYKDTGIREVIQNRYIRHNGYLLRLSVMYSNEHGYYVIVHQAYDYRNDAIIYCIDEQMEHKRFKYRWGTGQVDRKLWDLYTQNKWCYVSNTEGTLIDDYIKSLKKMGWN